MRDQQMFDILQNLDNKGAKKQNLNESRNNHNVSSHTTIDANSDSALQKDNQSTMRGILDSIQEGLDANQRRVNQMPGTHKMRKAGTKNHPAGKFLVGGEEGGVPSNNINQVMRELEEWLAMFGDEADDAYYAIADIVGQNGGDNTGVDYPDDMMGEAGGVPSNNINQVMRELEEWLAMFGDEADDAYYAIADIVGQNGGDNTGVDYPDDMMGEANDEYDWGPEDPDDYDPNYGKVNTQRNTKQYDDVDDEDHGIPDLERDLERADYFNDPFESAENDMEESYDPETMSFRKMPVTEDDIEEDTIADKSTARKTGLHGEKASFKDVFKSMSENDDEKAGNLEKELHTEIKQNVLAKNDKGTYNLNDDKILEFLHTINESNVDDKINHLKQLMMHGDMGREVKQEVIRRLRELQSQKKASEEPTAQSDERDPDSFVDVPTHTLY